MLCVCVCARARVCECVRVCAWFVSRLRVSFFCGGAHVCLVFVCTGKSKAHESSGVCEQVSFHDFRGYVLRSNLGFLP